MECNCKPDKITLKTAVIPATLGDEHGTLAPKAGAYYDTLVGYQASGAVYYYDSHGAYTLVEPGGYSELVKRVEGFEESLNLLKYELKAEEAKREAGDERVRSDLTEALTAETEARSTADDQLTQELQSAVAAETEAREQADAELNQRIENLINSPDVRYVVANYAELQSIDKSTIGDKDYARVLEDEQYKDASTYYQFNKAANAWEYVGQTKAGDVYPYMPKTLVDPSFGQSGVSFDYVRATDLMTGVPLEYRLQLLITTRDPITGALGGTRQTLNYEAKGGDLPYNGLMSGQDKNKLDGMLEIKALGSRLALDEDGKLYITGGQTGGTYPEPPIYPYEIDRERMEGHEHGAVAYLRDDEVHYYVATQPNEFTINSTTTGETVNFTCKTLDDGFAITNQNMLAFALEESRTATGSYSFRNCPLLQSVYFPKSPKFTTIGSHFLWNCRNFIEPMVVPDYITSIGNYFMAGCTAYNQPLTISAGITTIPDYFLSECSNFNSPIIFRGSSINKIGSYFLYQCSKFNQPLTLPAGIATISERFMYQCISYQQPLTLPDSLRSVGSYFMYAMNNFTGPLNIECSFVPINADMNTLSVSSSIVPAYTQGVTLTGSGASIWKTSLPNRSSTTYRNLILAEE